MDLKQFRVLRAVDERGSLVAAAQVLGVTQPVLSRIIAGLESDVGTALFTRTGRGMAPTPAGRALAERARRILDDVDDAVLLAERVGRDAATSIVVGMVSSAMYSPLADAVAAFAAQDRAATVTVRELTSRQVVAAVLDGGVDIGVGRSPVHHDGARSAVLRRDGVSAVVGLMHPLAGATSVSLQQLASLPLIAPEPAEEPDLAAALRPLLRTARVHTARDSWMITRLASIGLGVGLIPTAMAEEMARAGSAGIRALSVHPAIRLPDLLVSVRTDTLHRAARDLLTSTPVMCALTRPLYGSTIDAVQGGASQAAAAARSTQRTP